MSKELKGTLMVLAAGLAWGISGVSGQYLMSHGVHINMLSSIRLFISGLVLVMIALIQEPHQIKRALTERTSFIQIIVFAIFGLFLNQYAYLSAIHYSNAGTATVLQYLTPILLLLYTSLFKKTLPTFLEVLSIFFAIVGTFLLSTHGDVTSLAISPTALFWGVFSAFTYCAYILIPAKVIRKLGSLTVVGLAMMMSGVAFPIITQSWRYSAVLTPDNLLAYFGIVGIGTIFAYTFFLQGSTIVGPVKASLYAAVEPIASIVFSVLIMGEIFYSIDIFGMLLIISAVLLVSIHNFLRLKKKESITIDK